MHVTLYFHFFFWRAANSRLLIQRTVKTYPWFLGWRLAYMSLNIPFALFQLNAVRQFCLILLSSSHFVTLQFLSFTLKNLSKETWCFSSINQEPVLFCLKDVKNSVNQGLTCKLSCSVLAVKDEFTITSLQSSRSFLPLEMKVFSSCERIAALLQNLPIFHQRRKEPHVFAFFPNLHISVIAFAFIINYSRWWVMLKLMSSHWCILQCFSSPLQVFLVEALWDWWKQDFFILLFFFLPLSFPSWATQCCYSWCHITWLQPSLLFSGEDAILSPR